MEESRFFVEGLDLLHASHSGTTIQTTRYLNTPEYGGFVPEKRVRVADSADRAMQCTRKPVSCSNPPPVDQNEEIIRQLGKLKETLLTIREDVLSEVLSVREEVLSMRKDFEDVGAIITASSRNLIQDH